MSNREIISIKNEFDEKIGFYINYYHDGNLWCKSFFKNKQKKCYLRNLYDKNGIIKNETIYII